MSNEHDNQARKFLALYIGVVQDNRDPEKLGRCRVRIPGLVDQGTGWALPLGWAGAGGPQRGTFAPPPTGAEVGVFFHMGEVDKPYYIGGNPGRGEQPPEALEGSAEDATKLFVHETARWRLIFDDRPGKELLQLTDKKTGDVIEIDGVQLGMHIKATASLSIECDGAISIKGASVTIQDKHVTRNGKAFG